MWTMLSPKGIQNNHMAAPVKVTRQQTTPKLSGTFRTLPPLPTPAHAGTLRNPPEPSGACLRNIHQHAPELSGTSGTFRNFPPDPTPAHTGTLQNLLEPAHTGTFGNLPESASGTYTPELSGTFRNLPAPSSGTCSCDPHRHTPELIWAEDPISLRCWGKMVDFKLIILFKKNCKKSFVERGYLWSPLSPK